MSMKIHIRFGVICGSSQNFCCPRWGQDYKKFNKTCLICNEVPLGNTFLREYIFAGIHFCGNTFLREFVFAGICFCGNLFLREFIFAEFIFAEFIFAEFIFAEFIFAEFIFAEFIFAEFIFAEFIFAEFTFADLPPISKNKFSRSRRKLLIRKNKFCDL